jgi:hypothetical protein
MLKACPNQINLKPINKSPGAYLYTNARGSLFDCTRTEIAFSTKSQINSAILVNFPILGTQDDLMSMVSLAAFTPPPPPPPRFLWGGGGGGGN